MPVLVFNVKICRFFLQKLEVRTKASELLTVIVLHAETNIVSLLDKIFPTLYKVYCQDESGIRPNVRIVILNVILKIFSRFFFDVPYFFF